MRRVVKRYANRKLYDTTSSRYVALDDVAAFVRRGDEVEVTDNESGEDLTAVTLAQIILEDERKKKSFLSLPVLQDLVRYGGDAIAEATKQGMEAFGEMREAAEKRVSEFVPESAPGAGIIDDMLETSRRRIDDLQRRVDEGLKESVSRLREVPGIGPEVERLENGLREIEVRLRNLLDLADDEARQDDSAGPDVNTSKDAASGRDATGERT
ncbi:MAG: polyhydroxyalkanoate synthesis regulator DNA-binding domain-containing protein [Candidatus Binatia bacterium]|nr:polyhydroxyalkanoate synthesis regulator DNA-binding domain-containing protein [Candidatus Binatia bacterium]